MLALIQRGLGCLTHPDSLAAIPHPAAAAARVANPHAVHACK